VRLAPWLFLLNAFFLGGVVWGRVIERSSYLPASPENGQVLEEKPSPADETLAGHLPLPGMAGWDENRSACEDLEAFLQAAARSLEAAGHLPPIRPGQQILPPEGRCLVTDLGVARLIDGFRQAFLGAGLIFPVEAP
jgi:hypothetical protein